MSIRDIVVRGYGFRHAGQYIPTRGYLDTAWANRGDNVPTWSERADTSAVWTEQGDTSVSWTEQ